MRVLDEAGLRGWLVDFLVERVGLSRDEVNCDAPLSDLAVGSREAVVVAGELSDLLGRSVSPVDLWQYPSVNALVGFLVGGAAGIGEGGGAVSPGGDSGDSVAVVGVGCRFPGDVAGSGDLWGFLREGVSAVSRVPGDRWSSSGEGFVGSSAMSWGAFLSDLGGFDAEFFGVSPREAVKVDPQQRLLLEVAWESLEDAGFAVESLRCSRTGVFVGACSGEYGFLAARDLDAVDGWSGTGGALSVIANRVSYFFDWRGPSLTVDTACSSSLVAVHLACQSLRSGECDVALAAGVNVLLSPVVSRSFDVAGVLSVSGGCHSFDAAADGFVRGEGCGVAVLKRLGDAMADGDRVLAVVRGSAVNQDGRSNGLMAPNPAAQMAVLRSACAAAAVDPREVDYVEAHGSGTLLGDPIEARALGAVVGRGRPAEAPLLIGSVKTNVGHLEAAAGIAGFLKAVLAIRFGHLPATLGFSTPNPHIPFEDLGLAVVGQAMAWPQTGRPRRAGVSSFGFGGTNAHVVIEQAPEPAESVEPAQSVGPVTTLVVGGKSESRVAAMADVLAQWMCGPGAEVGLGDVAHTLNHHRSRQAVFATVCARDRDQAVAGLQALAAGHRCPGVVEPHVRSCGPGTVFVYSGQGSQWAGMGRRLLAEQPAFAVAVEELDPVFVDVVGFSLQEVLQSGAAVVGIASIQPVLVGVQLALTQLWRSHGVVPDAVIGHSMGEVTAAVVAQGLTVAQGLEVIATRSQLMARLSGQGAMALVELDAAGVQDLIADRPQVSVAVYASPRQSVIAGPPGPVDELIAEVDRRGRLARRIEVDVASHHHTVDPILTELRAALAGLKPQPARLPVVHTTEFRAGTEVFGPDYWVDNLRNPVRFQRAVATAATDHTTFIEISPHPLLTHAITENLHADAHHHVLGTLVRHSDETLTFHTHLNSTHTTRPPRTPHPPHTTNPLTPLPHIRWHHTHHWAPMGTRDHEAVSAPRRGTVLGARTGVSTVPPLQLWQARLVLESRPYPGHHRIDGAEVVPISVLLRTLAEAASECGASAVIGVRFEHPMILDQPRIIQVVAEGDALSVSSHSGTRSATNGWICHVSASATTDPCDTPPVATDAEDRGEPVPDWPALAELAVEWGIEGQPYAWSLHELRRTADELIADIELPITAGAGPDGAAALLDAAVHVARLVDVTNPRPMLPAAVGSVRLTGAAVATGGTVRVRRRSVGEQELVVDIIATTSGGVPVAELTSVRYVDIGGGADGIDPRGLVHTIQWRPWTGTAEEASPPDSLALVGRPDTVDELQRHLATVGYRPTDVDTARCVVYLADSGPQDDTETHFDCSTRLSREVSGLLTRLVQRDHRHPATLWIVTRGVRDALTDTALRHSCLWGLAGVIRAEQPQLWGGVLDIADGTDGGDIASALATVMAAPAKSIVALRAGALEVTTVGPLSGTPTRAELRCRPEAAYLITGGLGTLGLLMAGWLADRGARRLILAGRTPLPRRGNWDGDDIDDDVWQRIAAIRALEAKGVSVDTVTLDIGIPGALEAYLTQRDSRGAPPIRGVIHAAGVSMGHLLTEATDDEFRRTMWPKVAGACALDAAFAPDSVDFLFLTASAGTVFGVPGQAAYAGANAYLDCLARARQHHGGHTVSLDWASWHRLGFGSDAHVVAAELARHGSRPITAQEAFLAWEHVHRYDIAQALMAPMTTPATGAQSDGGSAAWGQLPPEQVVVRLREGLRTIISRELQLAEGELDIDRPFAELGVSSLIAMAIRRETEELVGIELSATILWKYPTIGVLADHLAERLGCRNTVAHTDIGSKHTTPVGQSFFDTAWTETPAPADCGPEVLDDGVWLVLADTEMSETAATFADTLASPARRVRSADLYDEDAVRRIAAELGRSPKEGPAAAVVFVGPDVATRCVEASRDRQLIWAVSTAGRVLTETWATAPPRLLVVTREGLVVGDEPGDPAVSAVKALIRTWSYPGEAARVLAAEPHLRPTLLDVGATDDPVAAVRAELASAGSDEVVARRTGRRYVERLSWLTVNTGAPAVPAARADGSYVVTGALGGIGMVVVRWLVDCGAGRVVLNGRSAPSEEHLRRLAELEARAEIVVVRGDIAEAGVAQGLVAAAEGTGKPLRGVVHAAGVIDPHLVKGLNLAELERIWAPKAEGALQLHQATVDRDLDWWVGFSSVSSMLGAPGQAAYACANGWLDGLVAWRRAHGLPAMAINWGQWADVGMGRALSLSLLDPMPADEGTEALASLVGRSPGRVGVARLRLDRVAAASPEILDRPFFAEVLDGVVVATAMPPTIAPQHGADQPVPDWSQMSVEAVDFGVRARLRRLLACELRIPATQIDPDRSFPELGLDSMMAMGVLKATKSVLGVDVSPTMLWDHPTISSLAAHLAESLARKEVPDVESELPTVGVLDALFDSVESASEGGHR
jgi:phthiocerol/phenolphthiocerol synthesis type-I polyketide synthase A